MREIKFRAHVKSTKMVFPVINIDLEHKEVLVDSGSINYDGYQFDEIDLIQYTGLKDKNGAEIYEGDVVKGNLRKGFKHMPDTGVIKYGFMGFIVCTEVADYLFSYFEFGEYEVIGNIYEHSHLLEGEPIEANQ